MSPLSYLRITSLDNREAEQPAFHRLTFDNLQLEINEPGRKEPCPTPLVALRPPIGDPPRQAVEQIWVKDQIAHTGSKAALRIERKVVVSGYVIEACNPKAMPMRWI